MKLADIDGLDGMRMMGLFMEAVRYRYQVALDSEPLLGLAL